MIEVAFAKTHPDTVEGGDRRPTVELVKMRPIRGRIGVPAVEREFARMRFSRTSVATDTGDAGLLKRILGEKEADALDRFDAVQLAEVVRVCRAGASLAEAGRKLFAVSRAQKAKANDTDRLRKYLAGFGLDWAKTRA